MLSAELRPKGSIHAVVGEKSRIHSQLQPVSVTVPDEVEDNKKDLTQLVRQTAKPRTGCVQYWTACRSQSVDTNSLMPGFRRAQDEISALKPRETPGPPPPIDPLGV